MSHIAGGSRPGYVEALRRWRAALDTAGCPQRLPTEDVALVDAVGRIPARIERTLRPSPTYRAAAMDGYAVRSIDLARASAHEAVRLDIGSQALPIDTGEPVPDAFDAVIAIERTKRIGERIEIAESIPPGKHVRLPGDDVPPGVAIGWPGRPLRPLDCAALLAGGRVSVEVVRRPRVAVVPTGDELVPPGSPPRAGTVIETNSTMIAQEARLLGAEVALSAAVADDDVALDEALRDAIGSADVVVLLAGSSAGVRDRVAAAMARAGTIDVRGVATRPARPVILGHAGSVALVDLPGYPVACHVAFDAYVAPLLRRLAGVADPLPRRGRLSHAVDVDGGYDEWKPATLLMGVGSPRAIVEPVPDLGGDLYRLALADARIRLPAGTPRFGRHVAVTWSALRDADASGMPLFVGPYDPLIEELAALAAFRCRWTDDETGAALDEGLADAVGVLARPGNAAVLRRRAGGGRKMLALGERSEGTVARSSGGAQVERQEAVADPWAGAAAVASGTVRAAHATRFVADRFGLAFVETEAVPYACIWEERPGRRFPWGIALTAGLTALAEAATHFGWKNIGSRRGGDPA